MELSRFNLWVNDYPQKGESLLFNTRTQALIKVDRELREALDGLPSSQLPSAQLQEKSDITAVHSPQSTVHSLQKNLAALKENGIVVESESEEDAKLKDFFRQLQFDPNTLAFEVTVLTTYSCNFRCVYCFEESVKQGVFLDNETSNLVIKWIISRAEKRGYKRVFLVYYGGEPLLNIRPIYDISWHIAQWAEQQGVEFGFGIITNGSLVSPDLIDKFLTVGLKEIRISLDGDREAHNKKRPFIDGKPSFDLIINNIKKVIDKVKVGIAGNFDRDNYASIPALLDFLEREGLLHRFSRVDFAPLAARLGPKDNPGAIELAEYISFYDNGGLFSEIVALKKELISRGVNAETALAINACPLIMRDGGVAIDPLGLIYKCNSLLGYTEFSVGSVKNADFDQNIQKYLDIEAWNKCPQDCPYIPMCQGGCRFFSFMENNNFDGLACKRKYFEQIVPELIKLEYEKLLRGRQRDREKLAGKGGPALNEEAAVSIQEAGKAAL